MQKTTSPTRGRSPRASFSPASRTPRTGGTSAGWRTKRSYSTSSPRGGGFARPSTRGNTPRSYGYGAPRRRGGGRGASERIDISKYINKAIPQEEAVYTPTHTFTDFGVHGTLAKNLARKGFINPSPIQDQAIPVVLAGSDIIGIASTGTGKTAAFLIPLIDKIVKDNNHGLIVLAPTRELAQQIEVEFKALTFGMHFYSVACVGGSPIGKQMRELEQGVHLVVGTPGRVKDLIARGKINMTHYSSIVLDEADRMLDMGFIDDMRYILGLMPKMRQTLFFSATFSPEIKKLCGDFLTNPVTIAIKSRDTASSVDQDVVRVIDRAKKIEQLHEILIRPDASKVLIFRETKRSVDDLARELRGRGFKALALHGDMRNRERERAVKALATGEAHIVIATDVAARGIDIPDITHVINYDVPSTYDTYVHRIGRTGRGTKTGHALTFV